MVAYYHPFSHSNNDTVRGSLVQQLSWEIAHISSQTNRSLVSIVVKQDVAFYRSNPWYFLGNSNSKKQISGGSGFFVLDGKYILTNAHVVGDDSLEYVVILSDNRELGTKIVWSDPQWSDLALLQVYDNANKLYTHISSLDMTSYAHVAPGDVVFAFGNPSLTLPNTVTMGIVSAVDRKITTGASSQWFIQMDANIQPGSSWWPLIGWDGRVIGVNTATIDAMPWVSFAVPIVQQDLLKIVGNLGK